MTTATETAAAAGGAALAGTLAKAILGAGMVSLPRTLCSLGAVAGTALRAGVAWLVYATMALLLRTVEKHPHAAGSFAAAAGAVCGRHSWGRHVAPLTRVAVVAFCFGFLVVDLVVIADLLRGSGGGACDGLICLVTGLDGVGHAPVVAGVAVATAPLLLLRSMARLSVLNYAGTAAAVAVAAIALGLGASAAAHGTAHPLPLLASGKHGGGGGGAGGGSGGGGTQHGKGNLVDDLAVVLTSFVSHQSLPQVLPLLRLYSPRAARAALAAALAVSLCVYPALSVGAALAFGPAVRGDALLAFTVGAMAPLLGGRGAAAAAAVAVQGGFALSVLAAFVLFVAPLRTAVAELAWERGGGQGGGGRVAAHEARHYWALTYGLLLAATATAIYVPNVWRALDAISSSSAAVLGFIVPGLMALAVRMDRVRGSAANPADAQRGAESVEAGTAGPLTFPLLLVADDEEEHERVSAGCAGAAHAAAAPEQTTAAAGAAKLSPSASAQFWELAASGGEAAFIAGCLLLGAALLANGLLGLL